MNNLQPGDILLVEHTFNWKDYNTYLIPLIHIGQNVSTWWGLTGPWFPYHHCAIVIEEDLYFEAATRCVYKPTTRLKKYKKVKVLRPNFPVNISELKKAARYYEGRVYDYRGVLIDQVIRYLSELIFNIFSLGNNKGACLTVHRYKENAKKRTYCSELVLELLNLSHAYPLFNSQYYTPKDISLLKNNGLFKEIDYVSTTSSDGLPSKVS